MDEMKTELTSNAPTRYIATLHKLKTWIPYFMEVKTDIKKFEVRKNDRNFKIGDEILLEEWDHILNQYTGNICHRRIEYILHGGQFGIDAEYVVLGLNHCY